MPVRLVKSGKRPGQSPERKTAIHHRVPLDVRKVIESDEAMPDHLRINPKRNYRETEQDQNIRSFERSSACVSSATGPHTGRIRPQAKRTRRGELAFAR